jgi:hypothetical protein
MAFGISNDIFGIYRTPSLIRFRIPLDIIDQNLPDSKKIEVQYHIFSRTAISQTDLCKGPKHVEDFMKSNNITKFADGGWTIVSIDDSQISNEKSQAIYTQVLSKLHKIFSSDTPTWNCKGVIACYNESDLHRKVPIYDVIFNR